MKELILNTISDSVRNLVHYDRKEDEELPVYAIAQAVENGEISIDEMVEQFRSDLIESL